MHGTSQWQTEFRTAEVNQPAQRADHRWPPLHTACPEPVIELVPSNRIEDLRQREADIAVRMLPPSQSVPVARRVDRLTRNGC